MKEIINEAGQMVMFSGWERRKGKRWEDYDTIRICPKRSSNRYE